MLALLATANYRHAALLAGIIRLDIQMSPNMRFESFAWEFCTRGLYPNVAEHALSGNISTSLFGSYMRHFNVENLLENAHAFQLILYIILSNSCR